MPKTLLSCMLSRLERLESPLLRHREIEAYANDERRALLRNGVLVKASPAESVRLRGRVVAVRNTPRGWYGVDEDDKFFAAVPLAEDDVRQYTISIPHLVDLLRRHNGIEGDSFAEDFGLVSVGQRQVEGIGPVDVYLSLTNYEPDVFVARCRHLRKPGGSAKVVLLVPRTVTVPASIRNELDAAGMVIVPLWRAAEEGSLAIDWHAIATPGVVQDGVHSARRIVYRGRGHTCDLTKKEMDFLVAYLQVDEIDVHQVMHTRANALLRRRYRREKGPRQVISQFLSRLNATLAAAQPPIPISYSLARFRDVITREASPESGGPAKPR